MAKMAFYDGKALFEIYHSWGSAASLNRAVEWAEANGMVNPENGKASKVGVRQSMWKWAINNPEESYEIWKKYYFERYPFKAVPSIQEYVKDVLAKTANNNPGISSVSDLEKLLMRFGLDYKPNEKVKKDDVIQIVNPNFAPASGMRVGMYGKLLIVDDVFPDEGFVLARMVNGDDTFSNHQLKYRDFGVIGRVIV